MRILAIETVELTGSVALLDADRVLVERPLDPASRSAQSLAPAIAQLLAELGWRPADVELVTVAVGPGSFTGLRIGVTTAKMFAYAVSCQVIGVNTMAAIAARVPRAVEAFTVVVDAHRNELFVADFQRRSDGEPLGEETTRLVAAEPWIRALAANRMLTGPGLSKWSDRLSEARLVDRPLWCPIASAVGMVGFRQWTAGNRTTAAELVPRYYRRTAAEENAEP